MLLIPEGFAPLAAPSSAPRGSDEWWMHHLSKKLAQRLPQIHRNEQWLQGTPPLPYPDKGGNFRQLQRLASLNLAQLITNARLHRIQLQTFQTAVDDSTDGDDEVNRLLRTADGKHQLRTALRWMAGLSVGYLLVDHIDPAEGSDGGVRITAEHPSQMIVEPNPSDAARPLAALKVYRDEVNDRDVAVLWRPGYTRTAVHEGPTILPKGPAKNWRLHPGMWTLEDEQTDMPVGYVPVVELPGQEGQACFEQHIPTMERINHSILQRMILIALQAFRQRGLKGAPRTDPSTGEEIDYDAIFESDPGSLWILPQAVEIWESGQADITPVLNAVRDDLKHLAAVSNTPLYMLAPDAANESASGSDLKREGIVFEVEDIILGIDGRLIAAISTALLLSGFPDRADPASIRASWADPRRSSLTERAEAGRAAKEAGVPWRTRMEKFMQLSPEEIAAAELQRSQDALLEQIAVASDG